jgi:hypothetical protein
VTGSEDGADIAPCALLNLDTFAAMIKERPDAAVILADLIRVRRATPTADRALKDRLPAVS